MATGVKARTTRHRATRSTIPADRVLYLYGITQVAEGGLPAVTAEGIEGSASVEPLLCDDLVCWISRVPRDQFADNLSEQMQDLEWLASAGLRHQRAVADIAAKLTVLPARFGTVFLNEESMVQHLKGRKALLRAAFQQVAGADEWGIKLFAVAPRKNSSTVTASSGADYLKKKADILRPRRSQTLDADAHAFIAALNKLAVASSPGGKASAGQPGLIWHASFLVRRKDRRKLEGVLKKYAAKWEGSRRIDWSGPWPPYSFVGGHVH